ncbi:hypothetical protein HDU79_001919 [Rhizoclosmatium sp. JEL0117]|nr:hypothetical protein HDU79_001919 [Rhizoclosmatium sp. JEL0117]
MNPSTDDDPFQVVCTLLLLRRGNSSKAATNKQIPFPNLESLTLQEIKEIIAAAFGKPIGSPISSLTYRKPNDAKKTGTFALDNESDVRAFKEQVRVSKTRKPWVMEVEFVVRTQDVPRLSSATKRVTSGSNMLPLADISNKRPRVNEDLPAQLDVDDDNDGSTDENEESAPVIENMDPVEKTLEQLYERYGAPGGLKALIWKDLAGIEHRFEGALPGIWAKAIGKKKFDVNFC